ncbi:unnamed protein product [Caretta caretta]
MEKGGRFFLMYGFTVVNQDVIDPSEEEAQLTSLQEYEEGDWSWEKIGRFNLAPGQGPLISQKHCSAKIHPAEGPVSRGHPYQSEVLK